MAYNTSQTTDGTYLQQDQAHWLLSKSFGSSAFAKRSNLQTGVNYAGRQFIDLNDASYQWLSAQGETIETEKLTTRKFELIPEAIAASAKSSKEANLSKKDLARQHSIKIVNAVQKGFEERLVEGASTNDTFKTFSGLTPNAITDEDDFLDLLLTINQAGFSVDTIVLNQYMLTSLLKVRKTNEDRWLVIDQSNRTINGIRYEILNHEVAKGYAFGVMYDSSKTFWAADPYRVGMNTSDTATYYDKASGELASAWANDEIVTKLKVYGGYVYVDEAVVRIGDAKPASS